LTQNVIPDLPWANLTILGDLMKISYAFFEFYNKWQFYLIYNLNEAKN